MNLSNLMPQQTLRDPGLQQSQSLATARDLRQTQAAADGDELKEVFTDFVGQSLFGQMLSAMRSTVGKPAYFHGGRGEEVFQKQLDQALVEKISDASADQIADPMYDLFQLGRQQ